MLIQTPVTIPNPVYDALFRYLMEDMKSAKIIISTLLGKEVLDISFTPQSHALKEERKEIETASGVRVIHLDFSALVKMEDGITRSVIIEMQKADAHFNDIFRFKTYIMENFNQKKIEEKIRRKTKQVVKKELPILLIPIFFLNFCIENEVEALVIQTNREHINFFNGAKIMKHNDFLDHLTYDMLTIQLPYITKVSPKEYSSSPEKTKVFELLQIFNQGFLKEGDKHKLTIQKYSAEFEPLIYRMLSASQEYPELEKLLTAEDDYLNAVEIAELERDNALFDIEEKDKALEEKDKIIEGKDKTIEEKDKALEENKKILEEQNKIIQELMKKNNK